jgi:hypothetical protein
MSHTLLQEVTHSGGRQRMIVAINVIPDRLDTWGYRVMFSEKPKRMRWLFATGVVFGAMGGYLGFFSGKVIGLVTAFMGGAILINVVYYEMPRDGENKMLPFLLGILTFVLIISFIRYVIQS